MTARDGLILALVLLAGCVKQEAGVEVPASNPRFEVARLFDVDGCTVYRFYDARYVYFTKCGTHSETAWRRGCGKNCVRNEVVSTDTQP